MPIAPREPRKAMRGKCERGRGKCERGRGSVNADGAGAKVFAGDGYSQKASFGPMAAISRHGQAGRIYNNTRARVLLRRMCVKPAALTIHSPPKTSPRPHTATRPSEHFRSPTLRRCTPADCAMHSSPSSQPVPAEGLRQPPLSDTPAPGTSAPPRSADARPQAARCIPHRPHNTFPAEGLRPPTHSDTPVPNTSAPPRSPDARPQAARCIPRRPHDPFPAEDLRSPPPQRTPPRSPDARPPTSRPIPRRPHDPFPTEDRRPSFCSASGTKKTAPHSGCAMPNVSVDRRCGRSFGLVSRALFAAVAGRWRVGVGLRPQPWALRSRRCGRVLRA